MKVGLTISSVFEGKLAGWLRDLVLRITATVDNGRLGFGDGSSVDNMFGTWVTYTSNAVANTEDAITHNLGVVPTGYLIFSQDKAASLYKGTTAWSTSKIFLKSSAASVTYLLFIPGPSNQGS